VPVLGRKRVAAFMLRLIELRGPVGRAELRDLNALPAVHAAYACATPKAAPRFTLAAPSTAVCTFFGCGPAAVPTKGIAATREKKISLDMLMAPLNSTNLALHAANMSNAIESVDTAKRGSGGKHNQSRAHVCVRRARPKDGRGVLQCLRAAFAPFESSYTPKAFLDTVLTQATLTERMAAMSVWVALDEAGKVIGTLACGSTGDGEGHLRGMAVAPSWQGRGVAEELLRATEDELQRSGCSLVTLDTATPLERARRFYEKHGFRPTGKVTDLFGMPLAEHAKVLIRR